MQGRNAVGTGLKPALEHLATPELIPARRCWVCRERPSRREREGKQLLPASGLVPGVVRRMRMSRRDLGFDPWAGSVKGGDRDHCPLVPAASHLAPGRDTDASALSVPRLPPRAGTKHTHTWAGEGVLIAAGAPAAVSVSQQQHRLSLASPDPDSG